MAKFIKLEVAGEVYYVGFSCRASVLKAEDAGFMDVLQEVEKKPVLGSAKLLQFGLMEKHPDITLDKCNEILEEIAKYNMEHPDEVIRVGDISEHVMSAYYTFSATPLNQKAKAKKLEVVDL